MTSTSITKVNTKERKKMHSKIEKVVYMLRVNKKPLFMEVMAMHQAFAIARKEFIVKTIVTDEITQSRWCYILRILVNDFYTKDVQKRTITEGKTEEFWRFVQLKQY